MGGQLGLCLSWLWLELGFGKLPAPPAAVAPLAAHAAALTALASLAALPTALATSAPLRCNCLGRLHGLARWLARYHPGWLYSRR